MTKKGKTQTDVDWENRVLCSDGNCIGVIGPDGKCKECGLPFEGKLPKGLSQASDEAEKDGTSDSATEESQAPADEASKKAASPSDDEWENRTLCSDGNCIGVIGPDGKCKECGKPFEG